MERSLKKWQVGVAASTQSGHSGRLDVPLFSAAR